jgi:hypothetical protein
MRNSETDRVVGERPNDEWCWKGGGAEMSAIASIERPVEQRAPSPRTPSRGWIWLGSVIGVLGLATAIVWGVIGVSGYLSRVNDLSRMPVPGQMPLRIAGAGEQFIYYEGRASFPIERLGIEVADPRGQASVLEPYKLDLRYDALGNNGRIGYALATFQATGAGAYRVTAAGTAPAGSRIAIGESVAKNVIPTLVGIIALLLVTVGGGLALIIVTLVRRSSARSALGRGVEETDRVREEAR